MPLNNDTPYVSALDYSENINMQFTFNSTLSMSISGGELTIYDLQPGTVADSNVISVNVVTNNVSGYVLTANAGNESYTHAECTNDICNYNVNDLILTNGTTPTSATQDKFTSLLPTDNYSTMTDSSISDKSWGYSYKINSGSWSDYSGLPAYNDSSSNVTTLNTTNTASDDTIKFKIGAKASSTQATGTYTNVVNFAAVTNAAPVSFYDAFSAAASETGSTITMYNGYYKMQDMTSDICGAVDEGQITTLIDVRDNEVYTVAKLKDGNCWMLDNLRLDPTTANLTADNTNATADAIANYKQGGNPSSMAGWANTAVVAATSGFTTYTEPLVNVSYRSDIATSYGVGSGKVGVYYNYCAATAGTYCYNSGSGVGNAGHDVCPVNWRMPTGGYGSEYWGLYNFYGSANETLSINLSGYFVENNRFNNNYGYYWSSSFGGSSGMYYLLTDSATGSNIGAARNNGFSIRCLAK